MTKNKKSITEEVQIDFISHTIDDFYVFYNDKKARVSNVGNELAGYSYHVKHQGDIYMTNNGENGYTYLLLMNQTCDLDPGNGKKSSNTKRYVFIELVAMDFLREKENGEFEKVVDLMLSSVCDGQGEINFDINRNDCFVIPANTLTKKAFMVYFSNIYSFDKKTIDDAIDEERITKQVTIYSPYMEKISSKFGYYFSRVAIDTFSFATKSKQNECFIAEIKKQPE